jgi:hypothetical protein
MKICGRHRPRESLRNGGCALHSTFEVSYMNVNCVRMLIGPDRSYPTVTIVLGLSFVRLCTHIDFILDPRSSSSYCPSPCPCVLHTSTRVCCSIDGGPVSGSCFSIYDFNFRYSPFM